MRAKRHSLPSSTQIVVEVRRILPEIRSMIEAARHQVAATANLALVNLYWNIGRVVTQEVQRNEKRAGYGEQLLVGLATLLTEVYGAGYSRSNLQDMRRFFECFEIRQPLASESGTRQIGQPLAGESARPRVPLPVVAESPAHRILQPSRGESSGLLVIDFRKDFHLGWTHYRILLGIADTGQRRFYFEQASVQRWSKRELHRQIDSALFERVALSRNTRKLVALEKKKGPAEVVRYEDIFKDPYILDFLGLKGAYSEKDLEAAIICNLEQFLSELGTDFCFIGRQYPMRIDDTDYFLDLLFYHRGLRCLVAIDLKLAPFAAADKGQMDLYLSWLKEYQWRKGENEPVGLILCTSKKRQHVELLLRHGPHKMQVSEYRTKMPSRKLLQDRLRMYGRLLEGRDEK
jgi:predicted nuclease of restriction endonuclease-like (RecB) superfamily